MLYGLLIPCHVLPVVEFGQKSTKAAPTASKTINRRSKSVPRRIDVNPYCILSKIEIAITDECKLLCCRVHMPYRAFISVQYSIVASACISHLFTFSGYLEAMKAG